MRDEPYSKNGTCKNCKCGRKAILHLNLAASGAKSYVWECSVCNVRNPFDGPFFISPGEVEAKLTQQQLAVLPVILPSEFTRCTRCGSRWAERHHWAPRAIFGDDECERWPTDYLCKKCHDEWHSKVTPQLVTRPQNG